MPFQEKIDNYLSPNNQPTLDLNIEIDDTVKNSKFNPGNYRQIINTTTFADMFLTRYDKKNSAGLTNFYPELGLIFLKSYIKQLFDNDITLKPEILVKIFNKNQELIEIPYPILLYLGGLYYFQLPESEPTTYIKKQDDIIINISETNLDEFNLKINNENKKLILPNIISPNNYGIQNNFLNTYNKALYGIYLNGDVENNNGQKPHIVTAGYLGIIKPIKTYKSEKDIPPDFNALYGNLLVNNYNYSIDQLVSELSTITAGIDAKKITNQTSIKLFIIYSKLKANFLSGIYTTKQDFSGAVKKLSSVNNMKNSDNLKSDFYYLISRVFFKKRINVFDINGILKTDISFRSVRDIPKLYDQKPLESLTNFLYDIWSLEKNNLQNKKYSTLNTKSVFTLYPSCGGIISPNNFVVNTTTSNNIMKNSLRFLWFETTRLGQDFKDTESNEINDISYFQKNSIIINNANGEKNEKANNQSELYKFNYILDSLDFEKLENLKEMFIDFTTFDKSNYLVEGYNLKSLILASSIITYDDLTELKDDINAITLTKDDINLALIGNSVYQYDYMFNTTLGKYLNVVLTKAQKTKAEDVCNDFCNNLTTIANFSTIGSLRFSNQPELSLHKFQTSPEILFSNATDYDSLMTFLGGDVDKTNKYLTRRILFNDQYIESFTELTQDEINSITNLNDVYLYNKLYTLSNSSKIKNEKELYVSIVTEFFRYLNIKYSSNMYKHLFKLIRTFTYRCLSDLKYLDSNYKSQNNNQSSLPTQSNTSSARAGNNQAILPEF